MDLIGLDWVSENEPMFKSHRKSQALYHYDIESRTRYPDCHHSSSHLVNRRVANSLVFPTTVAWQRLCSSAYSAM